MSSEDSEQPAWVKEAGEDYTNARFGVGEETQSCESSTCRHHELARENASLRDELRGNKELLDQVLADLAGQGDSIRDLTTAVEIYKAQNINSHLEQIKLYNNRREFLDSMVDRMEEINCRLVTAQSIVNAQGECEDAASIASDLSHD